MRNNIFDISRIGLHLRQNFKHHYKLFTLSLTGACGGIFILLLCLQIFNKFHPVQDTPLFITFIFLFFGLGLIYSGTAFPGLRSKEKSYSYLLIPASTLEKFLLEYLSRVLLFVIVMPVLFWIIYIVEGYFAALISKNFVFQPLMDGPPFIYSKGADDGGPVLMVNILIASFVLMAFHIPFTGATIFTKYPLIKTLFAVVLIFFFHSFMFYFFMETLGFKHYAAKNATPLFFLKDKEDAISFFTFLSIIYNLALLTVAYFKLKEKEV